MSKRTFIKDPLWGNVELFSWEACLTNHFIVNRLTNIIQNSSAFRAYPGLKYSRFLHTIGVVHVVTQLASNAIKNAKPEILKEFQKEANAVRALFSEEQHKLICDELSGYIGQHPEFAPLLATLRTCAFIHDLGHMPYSHVFENALDAFTAEGIEKTIKFSPDVAPLRKQLQKLIHGAEHGGNDEAEPEKLHERIGVHLANALASELGSENNLYPKLASSLIHAACQLLREHKFPIAETFIKGTVDADRIDFIQRDGTFSGLFTSAVDYDRLFKLYTLEEVSDGNSKKVIALPSARSVSETEKLLWERFQDYKYIVMHHKVHLYDEVVENIVVHLMADGKLNGFLKDLISLLELEIPTQGKSLSRKSKEIALLESVLLQFDDPWLESHIRNIYRKIISDQINGQNQDGVNHDSDILFQVYVEERRRFTSVFKSDCEFWDAVDNYAPKFKHLRPKEPMLNEETVNHRAYFFSALYAAKFALQELIKDQLKVTVLIGPTDRKVSYGVRNDDVARSYQVNDLLDFLKHKKYGTMLFNLWFDSESKLERKAFLEKAMPIIQDFISDAILQAKWELPA